MDKYQMLDAIVVLMDRLADARGAERCTLVVDIIQRIDALKKGMREEDRAHKQELKLLETQIKELTNPRPLQEGEIREGGGTYTIDLEQAELAEEE